MRTKSPTTPAPIPPRVRPLAANADPGAVAASVCFGRRQPGPVLELLRLGAAVRGDWRSWPPPEPAR